MRRAQHIRRPLTEEERARIEEVRRLTKQDEAEIRRKVKQYKQEYDAGQAALKDALLLLKAERVRQGLSLSDIQDRVGIERPNLSRLENDADANPTVATLIRYAEAIGKKLLITLVDRPAK